LYDGADVTAIAAVVPMLICESDNLCKLMLRVLLSRLQTHARHTVVSVPRYSREEGVMGVTGWNSLPIVFQTCELDLSSDVERGSA